MAEAAVYYYETEIDWKGEKDLRLGAGKLPVIGAGAPPEFKGQGGELVAGASFRRLAEHLLYAHLARHRGVFQNRAGERVFDGKGKIRKGSGRRVSNHRNRRKAASRSRIGERSDAYAANLGKS